MELIDYEITIEYWDGQTRTSNAWASNIVSAIIDAVHQSDLPTDLIVSIKHNFLREKT